jgi:PAS domain S-box-containing protein
VNKQVFVSASKSASWLFGMPVQELLQVGPVDVSPEYQPDGQLSAVAAKNYIGKAIIGEKPVFEWTHCNKAGDLIPCELWLVRLPSENGILIRGSIVDITERKKAAEETLRSKKQFQNLVENISGVYWVNDLQAHKTLYISPSYETIWGSSCEALYQNPADFINAVHPDDREMLETAFNNISGTDQTSLEYRIIRSDGEVRWIHANTNIVIDEKGGITEYGYAEDITERRKSEEELLHSEQKYRLLFNNNPLPMWMATIPGLDIIDVNESAVRIYGYTRKEFLKMNTRDLRNPEDIPDYLKEVDSMKPGIINARTWQHKKKDGSILQVETYSHEIIYEGRRVWLCLSHDVTERNEAKELLEKSYEDIRQLASNLQSIREDERTNIAREIHDELGQQLTGLKMDLHWLIKKVNSPEKEINVKMNESIDLINAVISSVRKISTDLRPSILDDLGLTAALEWQSEEFEKRSGTQVKFINEAGDITVDPKVTTAIFRIYQELLTNIARHANASLVTALLQKKDKQLILRITDNGSGFNLESISNKKTLGLLGIKERTLLLDGTYEFKSSPGEGSETIISIPFVQE